MWELYYVQTGADRTAAADRVADERAQSIVNHHHRERAATAVTPMASKLHQAHLPDLQANLDTWTSVHTSTTCPTTTSRSISHHMSVNSHCHCFETRILRTHQVLHLFPPLYNPWWVEGFNNEKFGVKNTTWAPNHYTISSAVATAILCGGLVPSISSQLLCHPLAHLVRVQYNQVYPYQLIYQSRLQWDWKYHHSLVYMLYHPILQSALWHRHLLVMVWGQLRSFHYLNSLLVRSSYRPIQHHLGYLSHLFGMIWYLQCRHHRLDYLVCRDYISWYHPYLEHLMCRWIPCAMLFFGLLYHYRSLQDLWNGFQVCQACPRLPRGYRLYSHSLSHFKHLVRPRWHGGLLIFSFLCCPRVPRSTLQRYQPRCSTTSAGALNSANITLWFDVEFK